MSGFKEYKRNPKSMSDVAPGGTPIVDFPISVGQIDRSEIYLEDGGTPLTAANFETHVKHYQLIFGGDTFGTYKPENVLMLNAFYGRAFEDGYLNHHFTEEWRQSTAEAEVTAFVPGLFVDPALRIELNGSIAAPELTHWLLSEGIGNKGRQSVDLQPETIVNQFAANGFPGLIKHLEQNIRIYASGESENDFVFDRYSGVVRGWHFKGSHITSIRMLVDGQERLNFKNKRALDRQLEEKGFVPQDDTWSIVPEALAGSAKAHFRKNHGSAPNEVTFKIKTSTVTNADVLVEEFEMPPLRANAGRA